MLEAPKLENDASRLAALRRLRVLDSAPERSFDQIVQLAAQICVMPTALVSMVDRDRQWFKARLGLSVGQTGRRESFCAHAIAESDELMVVEDARADPRFADNPLVAGEPYIRFYAGAPIVTEGGHALGTVCVIDDEPRQLEDWQLAALRTLAAQVGRMLDARGLAEDLHTEALTGLRHAHRDVQRLNAIAAGGDEMVAYVDADGLCRFVNDELATASGGTRTGLIGRSLASLVGEPQYQRRLAPLFAAALDGQAVDTELPLRLAARGRRQVLLHLEPAYGPGGQLHGVVVRARDVQPFMDRMGELALAVERLEGRLLSQERMLRILAHDLREPLNTIINFGGLLAPRLRDGDPRTAEYLGYMRRGADHLRGLLGGLMRYVRTGGELALDEVPLVPLLEHLRQDLDDALARHGGTLRWGTLPSLRADPVLLRVLLANLINNALRYARPGVPPQVEVQATDAGDAWEITVMDNGRGIAPEHREQVFDLFRRLHGDAGPPGEGMGLSICRRIVQAHGGRITVDDAPGGHGCAMKLHWPKTLQTPASGRGD